jgi:hypothetical protein
MRVVLHQQGNCEQKQAETLLATAFCSRTIMARNANQNQGKRA